MAGFVTALKSYGQHFLHDKPVLGGIAKVIKNHYNQEQLIEIGPGTGALTEVLLKEFGGLTCIEVDKRCIDYLNVKFREEIDAQKLKIISGDFLKINLDALLRVPTAIVGNFPYNISSQIVFRMLENYERIPFMVGMFQKEMAGRIASGECSKEYGVISVLTQLMYEVSAEFDIPPSSFSPPPKVMSTVLSFKRRNDVQIDFDYGLFRTIVKAAFNKRRKMLRNGLAGIASKEVLQDSVFQKRAEQLSVPEFIDLTKLIEAGEKE
jgi:16S rRNA (adenine1518-N6/adenine1519-N6)-dimethyltransferase